MLKKIRMFFTVTMLFLMSSTVTFGAELAGDEVVYCDITINVIDASGTYDGDAITVTFKDVTETATEKVKLTKENSWGKGETIKHSLPAPTTYNVIVSGVKKGYELVDTMTYEAIESFPASEGVKDFYWSIISTSDAEDNSAEKEKTENKTTSINRDNINVNNEEAEAVYQEFLQAVSFIETDSTWYDGFAAFLNQYGKGSINEKIYSQWYAEYVENGTVEEYLAMSPYEQFLWTETYTRLAYAVGGSNNYDQYLGNEDNYKTHVTSLVTNMMNGNDKEIVKDAYEKMMAWQYLYIKEKGVPFNFIRNRNYIEEIGQIPSQNKTEVKTEEEEIEELREEILSEDNVQDEKETEEGVWSGTIKILAENALSILILIAMGLGVLFIGYKRKQKNIDDNY